MKNILTLLFVAAAFLDSDTKATFLNEDGSKNKDL